MKRDFTLRSPAFDTMVAAQFLGMPGRRRCCARFSAWSQVRQGKDDWAVRPLTPEQEHYAAEDVRH
jgi:ribonuclease D